MDGQWQVLPAEGDRKRPPSAGLEFVETSLDEAHPARTRRSGMLGMLRILLVASLIDPAVAELLVVLVVAAIRAEHGLWDLDLDLD